MLGASGVGQGSQVQDILLRETGNKQMNVQRGTRTLSKRIKQNEGTERCGGATCRGAGCQGSLLEEVTFGQSPEGDKGGSEPWLYIRQEQFWVTGTAHAKALG